MTDDNFACDSIGAPWQDDSIEIYIDADGGQSTCYGPEVAQLIFRVFDENVNVGARTTVSTSGVHFVERASDGQYSVEVGIPWATFGLSAPSQRLGIDVHVNDDQNGLDREARIATLTGTDQAWTDPSSFGKAYLYRSLFPNR